MGLAYHAAVTGLVCAIIPWVLPCNYKFIRWFVVRILCYKGYEVIIVIRPMQLSDVPRVAEIHVFGWRCAYRGIVSDEHLFNTLLVSKRMERFEESLRINDYENYVYDDGIIKAFLTVGPCRDEDRPEAFELWGIYVDPCMQGQGIGTALVAYGENIAARHGYNEICIWTFEKNAPARAFYEKHGYAPDGATQIVEPYGAGGVRYHKNI